jgi:ribosome maturation factor RimP
MITEEKIAQLVSEKIQNKDLFLVDVVIKGRNRISVFLDSDTGVKIKDCAEISRHIESNLNREEEDFELEVSSAGLDQPLKLFRQFQKNVGKDLKILTDDEKSFVGLLKSIENKQLLFVIPANKKLKTPEQEIVVSFGEIREAKIVIRINN